jgi:hypothetical protein
MSAQFPRTLLGLVIVVLLTLLLQREQNISEATASVRDDIAAELRRLSADVAGLKDTVAGLAGTLAAEAGEAATDIEDIVSVGLGFNHRCCNDPGCPLEPTDDVRLAFVAFGQHAVAIDFALDG